jgi:hypothetical protein
MNFVARESEDPCYEFKMDSRLRGNDDRGKSISP